MGNTKSSLQAEVAKERIDLLMKKMTMVEEAVLGLAKAVDSMESSHKLLKQRVLENQMDTQCFVNIMETIKDCILVNKDVAVQALDDFFNFFLEEISSFMDAGKGILTTMPLHVYRTTMQKCEGHTELMSDFFIRRINFLQNEIEELKKKEVLNQQEIEVLTVRNATERMTLLQEGIGNVPSLTQEKIDKSACQFRHIASESLTSLQESTVLDKTILAVPTIKDGTGEAQSASYSNGKDTADKQTNQKTQKINYNKTTDVETHTYAYLNKTENYADQETKYEELIEPLTQTMERYKNKDYREITEQGTQTETRNCCDQKAEYNKMSEQGTLTADRWDKNMKIEKDQTANTEYPALQTRRQLQVQFMHIFVYKGTASLQEDLKSRLQAKLFPKNVELIEKNIVTLKDVDRRAPLLISCNHTTTSQRISTLDTATFGINVCDNTCVIVFHQKSDKDLKPTIDEYEKLRQNQKYSTFG